MSSVPLDELFAEPAARVIETRGGVVLRKSPARIHVDQTGAIESVNAGTARIDTRVVISAVAWHALGRLWDGETPASIQPLVENGTALGSSPIVTVNFWFDGPVLTEPFIGLIGGPMHWVFDKSAIFGEQAGHLSVVSSGASDLASMDNAAITGAVLEQLRRALPLVRSRKLLRSVVVREHRATFSLAPGGPARPAAATALPEFYLAGDWTDTGLPGTIEGAVKSGRTAAEAAIRRLRA
jgi:predicted NAD/FAD-dependent oxidoreductase